VHEEVRLKPDPTRDGGGVVVTMNVRDDR
jgi:hypothetical protein